MAQRKRAALLWHAFWTPEIENWTKKQIHTNIWRFDSIENEDDLLQDARILFFKVLNKYRAVNDAPHLFALYRTSLRNMFHDKSRLKQRSAIDQTVEAEAIVEEMGIESTMPNLGFVNALLQEMPDDLKIVLRALTTGRVRLKLDRPTTNRLRKRENNGLRVKRRLGLSSGDPVGELKTYLAHI